MFGLQDASNARIEIVVMKVIRKLLVILQNYVEVAFNEIEALNDASCLKEMGFREDQHHECSEQLLILYQLHIAFSHLCAEINDLTPVHLSEKYG